MIVLEWIVQGFFFGIGIMASNVTIEFVTKRVKRLLAFKDFPRG